MWLLANLTPPATLEPTFFPGALSHANKSPTTRPKQFTPQFYTPSPKLEQPLHFSTASRPRESTLPLFVSFPEPALSTESSTQAAPPSPLPGPLPLWTTPAATLPRTYNTHAENMATLPEHVHAALTNLLRGLQSPDNVERTAAEQQLNEEWFSQRPDVLFMGLSEQLDFAPDSTVSKTLPFYCIQTD